MQLINPAEFAVGANEDQEIGDRRLHHYQSLDEDSSGIPPELLSDLQTVGMSEPPTYNRLKNDDGARLFARLLYEGMQE